VHALKIFSLLSGHPLAMAAGIAALDVYKEQKLFEKSDALAPYWQEAIHSLKGLPHVVDIRNMGLMGAVQLEPVPGHPTKRAADIFDRLWNKGIATRFVGTNIAFAPPLVSEKTDLDTIVNTMADAIVESAKCMSK
jgi:beta-alanine--pyruvate transaminase